jgi:TPR repeat protein
MATREELLIIRAARAGQAEAQLALGKRYLFGGNGLPQSSATALYWLDRAAHQEVRDAWMLIGTHVPFEVAQKATRSAKLRVWYERAFDAGMVQAGLVFAKLVLQTSPLDPAVRRKALAALEAAARAGIADAQWLLAQQIGGTGTDTSTPAAPKRSSIGGNAVSASPAAQHAMLKWASSAAEGGVAQAQYALAEHAWALADYPAFLRWALPLARALVCQADTLDSAARPLRGEQVLLLSRCAQALLFSGEFDANEIERLWELAALAEDRHAQLYLGLWFAKMDAGGKRITHIPRLANYKKSIRWLTLAGEQGMAEAWYALSKIYLKPECSQRNLPDAHRYLEKAAAAGHGAAQLELAIAEWRSRRVEPGRDIRTAYWLLQAAAQGIGDAQAMLKKVAICAQPAAWAQAAQRHLTRDLVNLYPFLAARIELAALFGLSRCEALLLDLNAADHGHCLVVDIRAQRARSKRRLILVQTAAERQALDAIIRLFENVDCGPQGPEGSYRQRLYRLSSLVPDPGPRRDSSA